MKKRTLTVAVAGMLTLAGCGGGDPLGENGDANGNGEPGGGESGALVVGSQQYYSNTIVAELYAQVLEDAGYEVEREFEIGQREVYLPELESGAIDVFPEYTGNLLQYLDSESEASSPEEIQAELDEVLPEGLSALQPAEATDQDSYVVTAEFAEEHHLESVGDLAGIDDLSIAANSEFETRPYGPEGLSEVYGVEVTLVPVEDSGGPLTVNALLDGDVEIADIYSADPAIEDHDLVMLDDPENLVLPQNVFPLASDNVDDDARALLDEVSAELSQEELLALNTRSVEEQAAPEVTAEDWLEEKVLL